MTLTYAGHGLHGQREQAFRPARLSASVMHRARQLLASIAAFVLAVVLLNWALSQALVLYEMHATGALSRAELSENYGMGLVGVLVVAPLSVLGALFASTVTWVLTSRHDKPVQPARAAELTSQRQPARSGPRG